MEYLQSRVTRVVVVVTCCPTTSMRKVNHPFQVLEGGDCQLLYLKILKLQVANFLNYLLMLMFLMTSLPHLTSTLPSFSSRPIYNKAQAEQAAVDIVCAFLRGQIVVPGLSPATFVPNPSLGED